MRRKQLYAILLAGLLAVSSAPASVLAEEENVTAMSETDGTPVEENTEDFTEDTNEDVAETPAEPTQEVTAPAAPVQETPAASTETAVQNDVAPQAVETTTPTAESTATPTPTTALMEGEASDDTGISIALTDGTHYFTSLQAAINAAPAATTENGETVVPVIRISTDIVLESTVTVNKQVCIMATGNVKISRAGEFTGAIFTVSGENGELQLKVAEDATLTLEGSEDAAAALISVTDGASFGMFDGVTLTGNKMSADEGGAITNKGGKVILAGGTVTGCKGAKGGIYSNTSICIQGNIKVSDNTGTDAEGVETTANLYVELASETTDAPIKVTGVLDGAEIGYTDANAADGKKAAEIGTNGENLLVDAEIFKSAVGQIKYDSDAYTIEVDAEGTTASLRAVETDDTPSVTPEVSVTPDEPTATPTPTVGPTATPTPVPITLSYVSGSKKWIDHSTVEVKMTSTGDCKWYYFFVDANTSNSDIKKKYDASKAVTKAYANTSFTVTAENVPEEDTWLVICAKPESGAVAKISVLRLDGTFKTDRPSATPTVTTRAARTYKVSQSTVTGLENALQFFPGEFYSFAVTGAGQDDTNPISGDERWIPLYWSTSKNPSSSQKNTTWRIGSANGIKTGNTYTMYIFCKKQTFNGSNWIDTDVVEYFATQFTAASISDDEWDEHIAELSGIPTSDDANTGTGGGDGDDADQDPEASEKDTDSTLKSAVSTADESPIGTMTVLAMLSVLAGGYILIRKRKKEEI